MNMIGLGAIAGFLIGCFGALAMIRMLIKRTPKNEHGDWILDRSDAATRRCFNYFVAFCAFGVLSGLVGFWFGGWPEDGILWRPN
ncbi:MAG: hypothetical protein JNL81_11490 [Hyphomonadaceae bacterium]|nr:hypothetical protein [Hyphomonadaceae bacterium]